MIYQVTPFEVYQKYLSLKQHFNKKDYDFFKFNGRVRAKESSFEKRRDRHHFIRLSKIYKDDEITRFFVSNFVKSKNSWVGDLTSPEGRQNYITWKAKIQGLPYVFESEIDSLFNEYDEFKLLALIPSSFKASDWSFIKDIIGETTRVNPSNNIAGT